MKISPRNAASVNEVQCESRVEIKPWLRQLKEKARKCKAEMIILDSSPIPNSLGFPFVWAPDRIGAGD